MSSQISDITKTTTTTANTIVPSEKKRKKLREQLRMVNEIINELDYQKQEIETRLQQLLWFKYGDGGGGGGGGGEAGGSHQQSTPLTTIITPVEDEDEIEDNVKLDSAMNILSQMANSGQSSSLSTTQLQQSQQQWNK